MKKLQINPQKNSSMQKIFFVIICVAAINLIANYFGEETAILVGNFMYIPAASSPLVVSIIVLQRLGT